MNLLICFEYLELKEFIERSNNTNIYELFILLVMSIWLLNWKWRSIKLYLILIDISFYNVWNHIIGQFATGTFVLLIL